MLQAWTVACTEDQVAELDETRRREASAELQKAWKTVGLREEPHEPPEITKRDAESLVAWPVPPARSQDVGGGFGGGGFGGAGFDAQATGLASPSDCRICVQAKGKDLPHRRKRRAETDSEPPVLQLDYSYWKTKDSADVARVLVGNLSPAGYGLTFQVRAKGNDAVAVAALLDWSMEAGLCGQDLRVRTDAEPSVMALGQAFACRRAPATTFLETAPVRPFGSTGAADRFAQSAAAQGRALRATLEQTWGEDLPTASPLVPWLVRHSAWLCNRFQPRCGEAQGQTAFEALQGRRYTAPVLAWSAPVAARLPTALQQGKLADRWVPGVFLGKSALADDNIIGTETGIMRTRSVKVLPVAEMPPNFLRRMRLPKEMLSVEAIQIGTAKARAEMPNAPATLDPKIRRLMRELQESEGGRVKVNMDPEFVADIKRKHKVDHVTSIFTDPRLPIDDISTTQLKYQYMGDMAGPVDKKFFFKKNQYSEYVEARAKMSGLGGKGTPAQDKSA
ncbi:unnamed protein product [Polarella glacialis]|uniref:Uncharacterized protein n=2 Tax=Polarella glacialis TaxID=89957 RepID=A0A813JSN4_POLGL|nr:unnamed protein product [Polarella glacialis]